MAGTLALLAAFILTTGAATAGSALRAAIVPGADLVGKIDFRAIGKTPIIEKHRKSLEDKQSLEKQSRELAAFIDKLKAATGLEDDDFVSFLFSCDVSKVNVDAVGSREKAESVDALAALDLDKPFGVSKMKSCISEIGGIAAASQVVDTRIGSRPAIKLCSTNASEPDLYVATSKDERTILFGMRAESLAAGLSRAASGKMAKLPSGVSAVATALPKGSQVMFTFVAPESLRATIKEQIAKVSAAAANDPGAAMSLSFISLFRNIQNLSFGIKFANDALVGLAADLGAEMEAQQTAAILQTMVIPMLQASMAQQSDPTASGIAQSIKVSSKGPAVRLSIRLTEEDLAAMSERAGQRGTGI